MNGTDPQQIPPRHFAHSLKEKASEQETISWLDLHRMFQDDCRTNLEPIEERHEKSRDIEFALSKALLQQLFFINAGALIALPSFLSFSIGAIKSYWTIAGLASFAWGLVFSVTSSACARVSMARDKRIIFCEIELKKITLNRIYGFGQERPENAPERETNLHNSRASAVKARSAWYLAAHIAGLFSIFCFIVGITLSTVALWLLNSKP